MADSDRNELGILGTAKYIDIDLGNLNDFEITLDLDDWDKSFCNYNYLFYSNNTEYGGIIEDIKVDTKANTIKHKGYTWRGLLTQKIIEPPNGLSYLNVTGDANTIIQSLIGTTFGDLVVVDDVISGFAINYQFPRYINLLDGVNKMLSMVGAKLKLYFVNEDMKVHIQAVSIIDYSDELEYSQDQLINFNTRDYRRGINHLICLGGGELTEREVIHLYLQEDGTIGSEQFYFGLSERVTTFDYANAEDTSSLIESGINRFKELLNYTELSMSIDEIEADLGDIVGGRERVTGLSMRKPIVQKILKVTGNNISIEFKVGD
ncbi:MAG: hypothetical protein K0S18_362 [Anaerocolumna sp.]|jgi:hypothetical protein|nr:hypothetical protein [Anaerocolumna sp.]